MKNAFRSACAAFALSALATWVARRAVLRTLREAL